VRYHFFRNVEQLFRVYDVPSALQAILICPFLNEKAKYILGKLSAEILGDYTRLKAALLQAILIRPFLNEKAKYILGKLSAEILGDYTRFKAALLLLTRSVKQFHDIVIIID